MAGYLSVVTQFVPAAGPANTRHEPLLVDLMGISIMRSLLLLPYL